MSDYNLTHLKQLEAESIHIMREVVSEFQKPVMLYSIGKDSAVLLHVARKAFHPAKLPFPLLHVDTTWKFRDMIEFRENYVRKELGLDLLVHSNEEGLKLGIKPWEDSERHTEIMKTDALKAALDKYQFDAAFGGARRDEEKSRAKERVFSFRDKSHRWDPKSQRPELWNLYNGRVNKGESIRVFPLSNWTELDVWQYIHLENIPIVPLYRSAPRRVINRDGILLMRDDDRMPLLAGEKEETKWCGSGPSVAIPYRGPSRARRPHCRKSSRKCCWRPPANAKVESSIKMRVVPEWKRKSGADTSSKADFVISPQSREWRKRLATCNFKLIN